MNKKTALIASAAGLVRVLGGAGIEFAISESGHDILRSETRERPSTRAPEHDGLDRSGNGNHFLI